MKKSNSRNLYKESLKKRPKLNSKKYIENREKPSYNHQSIWRGDEYVRLSPVSSINEVIDKAEYFKGLKSLTLLKYLPRIHSVSEHGRGSYKVGVILLEIIKNLGSETLTYETYKFIECWVDKKKDRKIRLTVLKNLRRWGDDSLKCYLLKEMYEVITTQSRFGKVFLEEIVTYLKNLLQYNYGTFWENPNLELPYFKKLIVSILPYAKKRDSMFLKLAIKKLEPNDDFLVLSLNDIYYFELYLSQIKRRLHSDIELKATKKGKDYRERYLKHLQSCREY